MLFLYAEVEFCLAPVRKENTGRAATGLSLLRGTRWPWLLTEIIDLLPLAPLLVDAAAGQTRIRPDLRFTRRRRTDTRVYEMSANNDFRHHTSCITPFP